MPDLCRGILHEWWGCEYPHHMYGVPCWATVPGRPLEIGLRQGHVRFRGHRYLLCVRRGQSLQWDEGSELLDVLGRIIHWRGRQLYSTDVQLVLERTHMWRQFWYDLLPWWDLFVRRRVNVHKLWSG